MSIVTARGQKSTRTFVVLFAGQPKTARSFGAGLIENEPPVAPVNPQLLPVVPVCPVKADADEPARDRTKDLGQAARRALAALRASKEARTATELGSNGRTMSRLARRGLAVKVGTTIERRQEVPLWVASTNHPAEAKVVPRAFDQRERDEIGRAVETARRSLYAGKDTRSIHNQPSVAQLEAVQEQARDEAEARILARRRTDVPADLGAPVRQYPFTVCDCAWTVGFDLGVSGIPAAPDSHYRGDARDAWFAGYEAGRQCRQDDLLAALEQEDARVDALFADRFGPEAVWHESEIARASA